MDLKRKEFDLALIKAANITTNVEVHEMEVSRPKRHKARIDTPNGWFDYPERGRECAFARLEASFMQPARVLGDGMPKCRNVRCWLQAHSAPAEPAWAGYYGCRNNGRRMTDDGAGRRTRDAG